MANDNPETDASNGQTETTLEQAANTSARRGPSETRRPATTSPSTSTLPLRKQPSNSLLPISSPSPRASPITSRNTSPVRKDSRPQPLSTPIATQPSAAAIQRALSAAQTPQLQSGTVADGITKVPRAPRSTGPSGDTTPHWPTSPRLKSPPPSGASSRRGSSAAQKKAEAGVAPIISVQSATPQSSTPPSVKQGGDETPKGAQLQTPAKGPSRGPSGKSTLETVQENSTDDAKEPSPAILKATADLKADLKPLPKVSDDETPSTKPDSTTGEGEKQAPHVESGSESAGTKSEKKVDQARPKNAPAKSYASLAPTKSRQTDGKQNMTVETETVASIPQSQLSAGDRSGSTRNDNSGSIRLKPSSETIRPKKERKRTTQKARSINQSTGMFYFSNSPLLTPQDFFTATPDDTGSCSSRSSSTVREASCNGADSPLLKDRKLSFSRQLQRHLSFSRPSRYIRTLSDKYMRKASSKADIFEQRVADAVEQANSSDSDETFVYESNPPEPQRRRHHSRTPSVTSSHSAADQQRSGIRSFGDALDDRRVAGKRSMKFSNNPYNEVDSPDSKNGSVRSHQPRHFGRFGRGGSQASMFDQDSPFTQASKLRSNQLNTRNSRPNSPRSPQSVNQQRHTSLFGRKQEPSYDFDAEGGDDERTPLVGTTRTPRSGRLPRRLNSSHSIDEYYNVRRHSRCGRLGGCFLGLVVLVAVILSAIVFLVMSNRPLYDVRIREIQNVLASEQEIMLDLWVEAVNPNAIGITITDMDMNVFAKSSYVGTGEFWRKHGHEPIISSERQRRRRRWPAMQDEHFNIRLRELLQALSPSGGVDEGTDPDDDLEHDAQTMLLGRIFHFDQELDIEGSPLKRHLHNSTGELRLEKPGNKTETGGSERWEKVLEHSFELIIRGVLKYNLPISNRLEKVAVSATYECHPNEGVNDPDTARFLKLDDCKGGKRDVRFIDG